MKKNIMKSILFTVLSLIIINIFFSCNNDIELSEEYSQFDSDELSYLYINIDSLVYDGQTIGYRDTIAFLHNNSDTLFAFIETLIYGQNLPYAPELVSLFGTSRYNFDKKSGIKWANTYVYRSMPDSNADIYIDFALEDLSNTRIKMNIPTDTAQILGKIYSNVYKFEYPINSPNNLKCIFFAKKVGFIKIESADGRNLERLDLSKDEIRTLLSD